MTPAPPETPRSGLSQRLFAWLQSLGDERYDRLVAERKQALFADLAGTVLEIGPGTGVNLRFYPPDVTWIGVEPNVFMHPHLRREAERLGRTVDLRPCTAERLPAGDATIDAVVSTLVLCSVDQPDMVLGEIKRVLKPGGRFLFIEHVAAPQGTGARLLQRALRPFWKIVGDGCHPDRETGATVERAGFERVELERFRLPLPVIGPHVAGVAVR